MRHIKRHNPCDTVYTVHTFQTTAPVMFDNNDGFVAPENPVSPNIVSSEVSPHDSFTSKRFKSGMYIGILAKHSNM